jgi:hypothetical protein
MVDFAETAMRKMCRNPKCRSKLPTPTSNEREAFCCKGCYSSFYLHRCRVCEGPIEQKRDGRRVLCKKAACRNAFSRNFAGGRYLPSSAPSYGSKTPDFTGSKDAPKPDRAWKIVAGSALTPGRLSAATISDGADCQWADGSYERIEAQNRRALDRYLADLEAEAHRRDAAASLDHCSECGQEHDLTDRANPTLCYPCFNKRKIHQPGVFSYRPDLSIPYFLLRQPPQYFAEAA